MNPYPNEKPLRILAIVNLPWDARLGAARVWIELREEWRKAGHVVEKFCLTDAFPKSTRSRALSALRQAIFPSRAAKFVRQNAGRFDVIDCLIGTLPFSKESLGFHGLIVARSVGLHRPYERFDLWRGSGGRTNRRDDCSGGCSTNCAHGGCGTMQTNRFGAVICLICLTSRS